MYKLIANVYFVTSINTFNWFGFVYGCVTQIEYFLPVDNDYIFFVGPFCFVCIKKSLIFWQKRVLVC